MGDLAGESAQTWDVVVVGAGPVGLMVGCELGLAGVRVLVVESRTEPDGMAKAFGLHVPAVEALYRRGMLPALLREQRQEIARLLEHFAGNGSSLTTAVDIVGHFAGLTVSRSNVDYSDPEFGQRGPAANLLPIGQQTLERILEDRAVQLGVHVRRGVAMVRFEERSDGVDVHLASGERMRCSWLVGADGGRSTVRRSAGFEFPGTDPEITGRQAVVEFANPEVLKPGWNRTEAGSYVYTPYSGRILMVEMTGPPPDRDAPVTKEEIERSLRRVSGTEVVVSAMKSATRFTDHARQADTYLKGRVVLAGDAAHVHSPFGGQGLNLGIGDAMNVGWKLAAVVNGWAPPGLLETYTSERHPVGAWVLDWTRAQIALMRLDPLTESLRRIVHDLVNTGDGGTYIVKKLSGVLQGYDLPGEDPRIGRSAPDLDLGANGRLGDVMREGRAVLIGPAELTATAARWSDRLLCVNAAGCGALMVRPDGYVAWATSSPSDVTGLDEALRTWLGSPR